MRCLRHKLHMGLFCTFGLSALNWLLTLSWGDLVAASLARPLLCSTFTLNLLLSCDPRFQPDKRLIAPVGVLSHPGLITFGKFGDEKDPYSLPEMPVFLLIGVAGGLMGALFNRLNVRLTLWRAQIFLNL